MRPVSLNNDVVWEAIQDRLPARTRRSSSGFFNFDCPLPGCNDKRGRCGVQPKSDGSIFVNCFNCGLQTGWRPGLRIPQKLHTFLEAIGFSTADIGQLAVDVGHLRSLMLRVPGLREQVPDFATPTFETSRLPTGSRSIRELLDEGCSDLDFQSAVAYLKNRGRDIYEFFDFHWSPSTDFGLNRRVLMPCIHQGRTIGWSARAIDPDTNPRYHSSMPSSALFNSHALTDPKRKIVLLVEGIFDAIAVDSVGLMGARLSPVQIAWIRSYRKKVILVPDRDQRGLAMIDTALQQGWHVAFPWGEWWDTSVKDAAEATRLYGRLWTLTSIIGSASDSPARIAANRQWLEIQAASSSPSIS